MICPTKYCSSIDFGSYKCAVRTDYCIPYVDKCLVQEINYLNARGIQTIGCCCGHAKKDKNGHYLSYIQVDSKSVGKIIALGYEWRQVDENGNGPWCFKPKSYFPWQIGGDDNG